MIQTSCYYPNNFSRFMYLRGYQPLNTATIMLDAKTHFLSLVRSLFLLDEVSEYQLIRTRAESLTQSG